MARGITTGFFSPFGPMAAYTLGRGTLEDIGKNLLVQFAGAASAIFLFKPLKAFIE